MQVKYILEEDTKPKQKNKTKSGFLNDHMEQNLLPASSEKGFSETTKLLCFIHSKIPAFPLILLSVEVQHPWPDRGHQRPHPGVPGPRIFFFLNDLMEKISCLYK